MMNCKDCGASTPVDFSELPVDANYSTQGKSCSKCGSANLEMETDTLDTFFDSSWYFLRFLDPHNDSSIFDKHTTNFHLPVDVYVGGKEHGKTLWMRSFYLIAPSYAQNHLNHSYFCPATLHLYYARFMVQFLHHLGLVEVTEPFKKLIPVGVVMGETYFTEKSKKYVTKEEIIGEYA